MKVDLCRSLRGLVDETEGFGDEAIGKIKRYTGTPGYLMGAAAKVLLIDHALKLPNPLPIGTSSEFILSASEIQLSMKWIF